MDVYCPKCGEPVDNDEFHDLADETGGTYQELTQQFRLVGCTALGYNCSEPSTDTDRTYGLTRQEAASALYDLLGDDMDGAAAMMEDLGY